MGYMTVVNILNDGIGEIERHPQEFVENIKNGMNGSSENGYLYRKMVNDYPVGNFANPMEVARSFHADTPQVFYVGGNCMTMLTDWTATDKSDIEFQLKRIKDAKSMINYQEKELKKKLEKIKQVETATEVTCLRDYVKWSSKEKVLLCKAGETYRILTKRNEGSELIIETITDQPVMIRTLELNPYFEIKK